MQRSGNPSVKLETVPGKSKKKAKKKKVALIGVKRSRRVRRGCHSAILRWLAVTFPDQPRGGISGHVESYTCG